MIPLTKEQLEHIANTLANEATKMGARGVIIAVSSDETDSNHSAYWVTARGPCLEAEGLSARIRSYIDGLWDGKITKRPL